MASAARISPASAAPLSLSLSADAGGGVRASGAVAARPAAAGRAPPPAGRVRAPRGGPPLSLPISPWAAAGRARGGGGRTAGGGGLGDGGGGGERGPGGGGELGPGGGSEVGEAAERAKELDLEAGGPQPSLALSRDYSKNRGMESFLLFTGTRRVNRCRGFSSKWFLQEQVEEPGAGSLKDDRSLFK
ncbi:hypothetical protein ACP70R_043982 [Stipagrostis hirtigluma subsp. patula]